MSNLSKGFKEYHQAEEDLIIDIANDFAAKFNTVPKFFNFQEAKWLTDSVDKFICLNHNEEDIAMKVMDYLEEEKGFNCKFR